MPAQSFGDIIAAGWALQCIDARLDVVQPLRKHGGLDLGPRYLPSELINLFAHRGERRIGDGTWLSIDVLDRRSRLSIDVLDWRSRLSRIACGHILMPCSVDDEGV